MLNDMIDMLSQMNGGQLFDFVDNPSAEKKLNNNCARLFVDEDNKKYFFAQYEDYGKNDNYCEIEMATALDRDVWDGLKIAPCDSYLILFWNVKILDDYVFKRIIEMEESESFYKKYVIYYTDEEMNELKRFLDSLENVCLESIINELSAQKSGENNQLAKRILVKIPFWRLTFPTVNLSDYEFLVTNSLFSARGDSRYSQDEIYKIKEIVDDVECDTEIAANRIIKEFLGDDFDEL